MRNFLIGLAGLVGGATLWVVVSVVGGFLEYEEWKAVLQQEGT